MESEVCCNSWAYKPCPNSRRSDPFHLRHAQRKLLPCVLSLTRSRLLKDADGSEMKPCILQRIGNGTCRENVLMRTSWKHLHRRPSSSLQRSCLQVRDCRDEDSVDGRPSLQDDRIDTVKASSSSLAGGPKRNGLAVIRFMLKVVDRGW